MDRVKRILIKLLVVFISFFFIDGGKTILFIADNVQILLDHNQNSDLEIPHYHNLNKYDDDEKWMKSNSFELSYSFTKPVFVLYYLNNISSEDYAGSVWQPPKSL
jgi:hypothetical protein